MIDAHRLAVFREVARAGSFAGAAAVLRHTPSAVSQQIAALERGTGAVLVQRSTRGVTLTDAGRVLLATADAIHAELEVAAQQLRALQAGGPQALTVVTFPSAGEPLLAPALTALTDPADPPVEVTVIEAEPDEALAAIRDGRADLALVYHFHTAQPPRGWAAAAGPGSYTALAADHLRLLVPAGHPLAGRPAVSLAELAGERWIHGWGDTGGVLDMLAAVSGFQPRVACRSSAYGFTSALVAAGVGVALVPSLALTGRPDVRDLQIAPEPTRYIGAYRPRRHQPNPAAGRLLAALRAHAATVDGLLTAAPRLLRPSPSRRGSMILINIKMQIRPDKMDEWLALADSYARDVNSEDGCLFFQFARSLTDENEFVCIEGFKDAEAGGTHVKQPYVAKFFEAAPDLVATQPQIIYIDTPHDGFGPMGEIQPR